MSSIVEIKASAIYFLARRIGEPMLARKLPAYQEIAPGSSPLDPTDVFHFAAQNAFLKLRQASSPQEKAEALVEIAQQTINSSRFTQARKFINDILTTARELPSPDREYYQAEAHTKLGWIADNETGYKKAITDFEKASDLLNKIGKDRWKEKHDALNSTITHFTGRSRLGLAYQDINPQANLQLAESYFKADLHHFRELRIKGDPRPANEGYQHLWLGVTALTAKNFPAARYRISEAGRLFEEYLKMNPDSGIKAHWYLVKGLSELKEGHTEIARDEFFQAIDIRSNKEKYPLGLALAQMGVAKTYFQERQRRQGLRHLRKAVQAHPGVLLYAANGRPQ